MIADVTAQTTLQSPCKTELAYRQFDYWIGEWEVKNLEGVELGSSIIKLVAGDCLIQEEWTSISGYTGNSMSYYNRFDEQWHQKWIGSDGIPVEFSGNFDEENKSMNFKGYGVGHDGEKIEYRFTFFHLDKNHIRQLWEQSSDKGTTWSVLFEGHYFRKDD